MGASKPAVFLLWHTAVSYLWVMMMVVMMMMNAAMLVRADAQACDSQTRQSCQAMVGYRVSKNIDISAVASLFSLNYTSLLGPNDINPSLDNLSNLVIPPLALNKPYLIPLACSCTGGEYIASVNYTVVSGDTLSNIASEFLNFVTYQQIANVSDIPNPDMILPGQSLVIPIPCSCLNETNSVALSYQVQAADSLSSIAMAYNTSTTQLQSLNSIINSSNLQTNEVLFVPLPVCKANFSSGALDGNLTVVEGAYELTAGNCVLCNCNKGILHCVPSPLSTSCGNMTCSNSSLLLGAFNASQGSQECSVESCVYKGYTTQSGIMASLEVEHDLTCPAAPPPETFYKPPPGLSVAPLSNPPPVTSPSPPSTPSSTPGATPPTTSPNSAGPLLLGIGLSWCWCLLVPAFLL